MWQPIITQAIIPTNYPNAWYQNSPLPNDSLQLFQIFPPFSNSYLLHPPKWICVVQAKSRNFSGCQGLYFLFGFLNVDFMFRISYQHVLKLISRTGFPIWISNLDLWTFAWSSRWASFEFLGWGVHEKVRLLWQWQELMNNQIWNLITATTFLIQSGCPKIRIRA